MKKIAVTGACGRVSYNLLFQMLSGDLFKGEDFTLNLIDIKQNEKALEGVACELEDCAVTNLAKINIGFNLDELFEGVDHAFLIGSKPRGPNMDRQDLLKDNGKIFVEQGKALNRVASKDVKVIVVGNPCNTNCLVCMKHAPDISPRQFCAMTRLDQNRAFFRLAHKKNVCTKDVGKVIIWGNHSNTQVVDFTNATIKGETISDISDLGSVVNDVKHRGAFIIEKSGASSAGSAAKAIIDTMKAWLNEEEITSAGVYSQGNSYGIDQDLCFSFPVKAKGSKWEIVSDYPINDTLRNDLKISEEELIKERSLVKELLG